MVNFGEGIIDPQLLAAAGNGDAQAQRDLVAEFMAAGHRGQLQFESALTAAETVARLLAARGDPEDGLLLAQIIGLWADFFEAIGCNERAVSSSAASIATINRIAETGYEPAADALNLAVDRLGADAAAIAANHKSHYEEIDR